MEPVALLNHGINLLSPAIWMALLLPIWSLIIFRKKHLAPVFIVQVAINFVFCSLALVIGLAVFGRDGKMLTYLAMVALSASTQWLLVKGWRG